jgi:pyruvate carboxylase
MSEEKLEVLKTTLGGEYRTRLNRTFRARRPWEPANQKLVMSFMPGAVVEYRVRIGDRVQKGDTLLLFRAMKMNNLIAAPMDGVVKSIGADPGTNVPKNALLVELE